MEIKETEKILEESANNIKMRDFSEVWSEIKDEIEPVPQKKFFQRKWFAPLLVACFALIFAIAIPIYLLNPPTTPEEIYYLDKLSYNTVLETEFFDGLLQGNVSHVSFDDYETSQHVLYKTENQVAKGGAVDLNNSCEYIKLKFYDKSVELNEQETVKVYLKTYSNDGLTVSYNVGECYPEYNIYQYDIFANYNNVNYFIEYMGPVENPIDFFNSFFN